MDVNLIILVLLVVGMIIFTVMTGKRTNLRNVCTRCSGTGEVNERWPDPDAPNGWHILNGICPKCKGKGRVAY
jgi:DnaJ-class molecular chaperone